MARSCEKPSQHSSGMLSAWCVYVCVSALFLLVLVLVLLSVSLSVSVCVCLSLSLSLLCRLRLCAAALMPVCGCDRFLFVVLCFSAGREEAFCKPGGHLQGACGSLFGDSVSHACFGPNAIHTAPDSFPLCCCSVCVCACICVVLCCVVLCCVFCSQRAHEEMQNEEADLGEIPDEFLGAPLLEAFRT